MKKLLHKEEKFYETFSHYSKLNNPHLTSIRRIVAPDQNFLVGSNLEATKDISGQFKTIIKKLSNCQRKTHFQVCFWSVLHLRIIWVKIGIHKDFGSKNLGNNLICSRLTSLYFPCPDMMCTDLT